MSIDHASGQDTPTAKLAAQIALDQPTLADAVRRSSERICKYAGLLGENCESRSRWSAYVI
jgi:hypothetical protein